MAYDVIIIGLGAMGSAAAFQLASRGKRVLGFDRFHPPHDQGSSHGLTRIIREAYFEHPAYVPLVQRAYELWGELERKSGERLLLQTGGLMIGSSHGVLVSGARQSAEEHKLPYETLNAAMIRERFPVFCVSDDVIAIHEPRAGILFSELAIRAQLELADKAGAELLYEQEVLRWEPTSDGVRVITARAEYAARRLIISAGAWLNSVAHGLRLPLIVERQVLCWFDPVAGAASFGPANCPIYIWEYEKHRFFYGFPELGDGVKIGIHHEGVSADPNKLDREIKPQEIEAARSLLRRFLPDAAGALRAAVACMYTNVPDEHFILDRHPRYPQVVIASPCSGHGFKFSPAIGEVIADMVEDKKPRFDLSLFSMTRF